MKALLLLLASTLICGGETAPPQPLREFRGAWVASVRCIDWPKSPNLSTTEQQASLRAIFEKAAALHLNAIMLQVRPAGDALYRSTIEPGSPWLTGEMGRPPSPDWDPLEFAIREAHSRGIQLHAWFNPFRALASADRFEPSALHISKQHPEWTMRYGGELWMDPGNAEVRRRAIAVMTDVARRYDVDGIHMDDYFYPYPIKNKDGRVVPFPDDQTFALYRSAGGILDQKAWRRSNMNEFIRELYSEVKKTRPTAAFSISPFGYWRPNVPEGIKGSLDPYEDLAADVKLWFENGWMDFIVPQLYWPVDPPELSFTKLYDWWQSINRHQRPVYAGIALDRVGKDRDAREILQQVQVTRRGHPKVAAGHVLWNWTSLQANRDDVRSKLFSDRYQDIAVPPPTVIQPGVNLPTPVVEISSTGMLTAKVKDARWITIQLLMNGTWTTTHVRRAPRCQVSLPTGFQRVAVRSVSATGQFSMAQLVP